MRASARLVLLLLWVLLMMPPVAVLSVLRLESARQKMVCWVCRQLNRILGLQIRMLGNPCADRPLLVVSNHCSYLDILVLSAAMPISFTPKSDIRNWPLIGWCCYLVGCIFIERKAGQLPKAREEIHKGLMKGRVVCLFPEGTTTNGQYVKPFKSGFFSLAEGEEGLTVQPVSVCYTHRNGKELTREQRSELAWYDESLLVPHLFRTLSNGSVVAEVYFHPPVTHASFADRKALCLHCEQAISAHINGR